MFNVVRLCGIVLLAGLLLLAGCGKSSDAKKKITIGIVAKSVGNDVFQAAHAGARDAARELSAKYGLDIQVNIQTPPTEDAKKQSDAIDMLVRTGARGIAISCSDADTLKDAIDRAVDAGVPVMCFDSDCPASKRMCYFGTDDEVCGRETMRLLAKEMDDKGVVAILGGNPTAPNLRRRVDAARAELKKHPGMSEIPTGTVYLTNETGAIAAQTVQQTQRTNPEIAGWCMIGGWPLFTADALPWPPGKVKVVSVDALPKELAYLDSGHVQVLIAQDCYGWGHRSVEILVDKILNHKDPEKTMIIDPLTEVTQANSAEWSKKWDKWLQQ